MVWKIVLSICLVTIVALIGWWASNGMQIYSKDKRQVITKVKDEIFQTETETVTWVDDFQIGMLPGDPSLSGAFQCLATPLGISVCLGAFSFYRLKRSAAQKP